MLKMKTRSLSLLIILFLLVFNACTKDDSNNCIDGNGDLVISTRTPGNFNEVVASGAYDISFSITPDARIDLFGDSNILPLIRTDVTGERLVIDVQNNQCYNATQTLEATLTAPTIRRVTLNGAGKISGNAIIQDGLDFEVNGAATINSSFEVQNHSTVINGSGDATLVGRAARASFTISGAGSVLASTLLTEESTIVISGAGDVRIRVTGKLNVTISGSGSVYYTGDPEITSNITGTGQIVKVG
jgi:hypothetical protein